MATKACTPSNLCLNILHANREVRSEATSIFYEEYINKPSGQPQLPLSGASSRD